MENVIGLKKNKVIFKAAATLLATVASVVFVQLFHWVGVISGLEGAVGAALLPMHIPVLIAGFMYGPAVGLAVGMASPVISSLISGMPVVSLLPYMVIELGVYGLVSGALSKTKLSVFPATLITQAAGRLARAAAILFSIYALGNSTMTLASIKAFIVSGLFGIILQWVVIPFALEKMKGLKKSDE